MSDETEDQTAPTEPSTDDPGQANAETNDQMNETMDETAAPETIGELMNLKELSGEPETDAAGAEGEENIERSGNDLEAVFDIPVNVSAVLGKSHLQVSQLLKLGRGAIVELDRKVGEAIDIYVNDRLVARGEVVLVDDRLGVTMTEIVKGEG